MCSGEQPAVDPEASVKAELEAGSLLDWRGHLPPHSLAQTSGGQEQAIAHLGLLAFVPAIACALGACMGSIAVTQSNLGPDFATIHAVESAPRGTESCWPSSIAHYRLSPIARARDLDPSPLYYARPGRYTLAINCPDSWSPSGCMGTIWVDGTPEIDVRITGGEEYLITCSSESEPLFEPLAELGESEIVAKPTRP